MKKWKIVSKVLWKVGKKVQKVWKVLKSWKKCGKVEKNANNFGKKLKKMKKTAKLEKFIEIEKKSKKVQQNHQKVEKLFSICHICAKKWLWECQKVNVLTYLSRKSLRVKNGVEKLSWRKIGNHQSVKNINGLTCLSRKSLKSEKFSRKNDLCEKFIIIGMWKKWMSSLARFIIFEERKMLSKKRSMRKIERARTEWKSKSGQRSYPQRH